jgi:hypothetical protein
MNPTQTHDHIPHVPFWFKFIVAAKVVVAVAVLGLAAYGATFNDFFAGNGYAIFCVKLPFLYHPPMQMTLTSTQCIALLLTEAYYLVTTNFFPAFFNAWVYLVMSFFQAVWWLACWANLASWASAYKLYYIGIDLSDFEECSQSAANDTSDSTSQFGGLEDYDNKYMACLMDKRKRHRDTSTNILDMCLFPHLADMMFQLLVAAAAGIGALEW